jgi:hypothetical protein
MARDTSDAARARQRAQRRTARELREGRYERGPAGRAYEKALKRMAAPALVREKAHKMFSEAEVVWSRGAVDFNIDRMDESQRRKSLGFTDIEPWRSLASIQSEGNVWWYHSMSQNYLDEWRARGWQLV